MSLGTGGEDHRVKKAVAELGSTHAQGYLVSPPHPGGDIPDWLDRYRGNGNRSPS